MVRALGKRKKGFRSVLIIHFPTSFKIGDTVDVRSTVNPSASPTAMPASRCDRPHPPELNGEIHKIVSKSFTGRDADGVPVNRFVCGDAEGIDTPDGQFVVIE
jgi:hypothetical protein